MACFSLAWAQAFLIWLVVVIAVIALVELIAPWILGKIGNPPDGGIVLQALRIIVWAAVAIFVIIFVIDIVSCFLGGAGLSTLPLRR